MMYIVYLECNISDWYSANTLGRVESYWIMYKIQWWEPLLMGNQVFICWNMNQTYPVSQLVTTPTPLSADWSLVQHTLSADPLLALILMWSAASTGLLLTPIMSRLLTGQSLEKWLNTLCGDLVRVFRGTFMSQQGPVMEKHDDHLVLYDESMQQSVSFFDANC